MKLKSIGIAFLAVTAISVITFEDPFGSSSVTAAESELQSFSQMVAGSYVIHFQSGSKAIVTFHSDGTYTSHNTAGLVEHGYFYRNGLNGIIGSGLGIFQMPGPDGATPVWARHQSWNVEFGDESFETFRIETSDADIIPLEMDPLDSEIEGFFPGELPLNGIGLRIPVAR